MTSDMRCCRVVSSWRGIITLTTAKGYNTLCTTFERCTRIYDRELLVCKSFSHDTANKLRRIRGPKRDTFSCSSHSMIWSVERESTGCPWTSIRCPGASKCANSHMQALGPSMQVMVAGRLIKSAHSPDAVCFAPRVTALKGSKHKVSSTTEVLSSADFSWFSS